MIMKNLFSKFTYLLLFLVIGICSNQALAQDITMQDKTQQEEVIQMLKKSDKWKKFNKEQEYFSAHYIVGAYYFNKAVEYHKELTEMTLVDYLNSKKNTEIESKQNEFLKKALPYLENAYLLKKSNSSIENILKDIYFLLNMDKKPGDLTQMNDV